MAGSLVEGEGDRGATLLPHTRSWEVGILAGYTTLTKLRFWSICGCGIEMCIFNFEILEQPLKKGYLDLGLGFLL